MADTITALLNASIATDPARPLVTYYDQATGERTELSGTTFANWIAKTANMLRDDYDVHDESVVALALPMHWQQLVLAFSAWALGACVTESPSGSPDVLVMSPDRMMELSDADAGELIVSSLDAMGRAHEPRPEHIADYTSEVRLHGDDFSASAVPAEAAAYSGGSLQLDHAHAARTAVELAGSLGIAPSARVLVSVGAAAEAGLLSWAVPTLVTGGSLVLLKAAQDASGAEWIERIAAQEAITHRL